MNLILKNRRTIAGVLSGAIGGYLCYHYMGCSSGTCAITSNPVNSTLYGAVMGGLLFNLFQKKN
jgi:dolichol kinase